MRLQNPNNGTKKKLFIPEIAFLIIRNLLDFFIWHFLSFGLVRKKSESTTVRLLNMLISVINTYGLDLHETFYVHWLNKMEKAKHTEMSMDVGDMLFGHLLLASQQQKKSPHE